MVEFSIPSSCPSLAIAAAAAHGSTDIVRGRRLTSYAIVALPLPDWCVTTGFALSSLTHFARDVGVPGSIVGHLLLLSLHLRGKQQLAFQMLLAYMFLVHLPVHYARVIAAENGGVAIAFALLCTIALHVWRPWKNEFRIGHLEQKIILGHVMCNDL